MSWHFVKTGVSFETGIRRSSLSGPIVKAKQKGETCLAFIKKGLNKNKVNRSTNKVQ